jgi:hypothetical protein
MNVELLPIAEKKIRQMGGEAMGVVVRRDDGILVAVTDSGRVTRLDDAVAGPVRDDAQGAEPVAFGIFYKGVFQEHGWSFDAANAIAAEDYAGLEEITVEPVYTHAQPADQAVVAGKSWTEELIDSAIRELVTIAKQVEIANTVGGQWPATAHQEAEKCDHLKRIAHHLGNLRVVTDSAHPQPAQQGGVPEFRFDEWWDEKARYIDHCSTRALARAAYKAGFGETYSATSPGSEWVRCGDRLPTEDDADCSGEVWVFDLALGVAAEYYENVGNVPDYAYWMPTGLKRPNPPKQEGDV